MDKKWYKWPEGYLTDRKGSPAFPWYTIIRRTVGIPFLLITFSLMYVVMVAGWGTWFAEEVRKDIF